MLTTYAVTVPVTATSRERCHAAFRALTDLASDWLSTTYPVDGRPAGVRVRVREGDGSPVWRAVVEETAPTSGAAPAGTVTTTTVSIVGALDHCVFDVRRAQVPTRPIVAPVPVEPVPPASLRALVVGALSRVEAYDAHRPVRATEERIGETTAAHALAAFADAPGRRLPLLIECLDPAVPDGFAVGRAARPLAGLAHVVTLTSLGAVAAFNELRGERLLAPGTLALLWPGGVAAHVRLRREMSAATAPHALERTTRLIIETAARVLPPPRLPSPSPSRPSVTTAPPTSISAAASASTVPVATSAESGLRDRVSSLQADLDAAFDEVESLEAALAGADRMIEEKQSLVEQQHGLVDRLVAQNVELAIRLGHAPQGISATSAADALAKAREACPHLTFHPRADASAAELQVGDPTRILADLHRLDTVAADWQGGLVGTNLFALACRNVGLDYAPDISDTAKHRYADDYVIEWRGTTVYANAHLRRGKSAQLYRIHLYLDQASRQVVVAYVGRHLRDKRSG
jgi:hypothetical protein